MTNMLEKVASALSDSCDVDSNGFAAFERGDNRGGYLAMARAALEALREPSEEMIQSGAATKGMKAVNDAMAMYQVRGFSFDGDAFDDGYPMQQAWQAMIDAALGEKV